MATMTVRRQYNKLKTDRQPFLDRAYEASELTLPFLLPRQSTGKGQDLPKTYQSLGARLVNTLSSKLLLSQFPPNSPFFKFQIDDFTLEKLGDTPRGFIEEALGSMERAVQQEVDATSMRVPLYEVLRHLIATGNSLVFIDEENHLRVFHLDQYVIERDPQGKPLTIIALETISKTVFVNRFGYPPPKDPKVSGQTKKKEDLELYTIIKLDKKTKQYEVTQEINDVKLAGVRATFPQDKLPWIPLRFNAIDGENYGHGLVEESFGDLRAFEGLSQYILEASAAAAKIIFLLKPGSTMTPKKLANTENLGFLSGVREDVQTLQLEKFADLRIASTTAASLETRLSAAFLLNQSVQRQAERVTAEEIRFLANELESTLGGIYSLLSHELQLPLVRNLITRLEKQGKLPALPKGTVKPVIVTGFEALGRSNDAQKIMEFVQSVAAAFGPQGIQVFKITEVVKRIGNGFAIDMKGLVKTEDELAKERADAEQAQQRAMAIEKLGPPAIKAGSDMIQTQQGQQQNG
jgi:hypothetical protein